MGFQCRVGFDKHDSKLETNWNTIGEGVGVGVGLGVGVGVGCGRGGDAGWWLGGWS